nr:hypothetical protein B0A51_15416 [Rachicladosporium sp. CCFEE 5018]
MRLSILLPLALTVSCVHGLPQSAEEIVFCGSQPYYPSRYTCYTGDFLCPILDGTPTLRCGPDCYLPSMYGCQNDKLVYPPQSGASSAGGVSATATASGPAISSASASSSAATCSETPTTFHLSDGPYENYFYSDCHGANHVVVTSPRDDSNLTIIGPRLIVAWPAGNSGTLAFFAPSNGINGTLGIKLANGTSDQPLSAVYEPGNSSSLTGNDRVGVSSLIEFNSSAIMNIAILGSIRTIRDYTEGPSILIPKIQDAIVISEIADGGVLLSRVWLDNETSTQLSFTPTGDAGSIKINNRSLELEAGTYNFSASFDYPQLTQLNASKVLNEQSQDLITQSPDQAKSLSFLSYSEKLLAGTWRFLTYFGRDSMISLLLLQPVLSEGEGGAVEAVIGAVLERLNRTDGSVAHEETLGDYATYLAAQENKTDTAPQYDYKMIDSDYYLPVAMDAYFIRSSVGQSRASPFLAKQATVNPANAGLSYADLARISAEKIMNTSAPFAQPGGQIQGNLIHLKEGQIVGEWRDSTYGIGGGRIPYDVNAALVPAGLRAIAALSAAGFFPEYPEWNTTAAEYAQVWEDSTLAFFEVRVPAADARSLVTSYTQEAGFGFPSNVDNITSDVVFHGLALEGNNDLSNVKVMNSDDSFRHFLLNTTQQDQLTAFVNQTANNILAPYPVGLSNPVGMLVANPAYGDEPVYNANFTNNFYHGTVVWSWQMAMMAAGLERQISRCTSSSVPDFCSDSIVSANALAAYNHLWDLIDSKSDLLSSEVWSWEYNDGFEAFPLGALPPPAGSNPTESDIRQLWSLTFLAVKRAHF